MAIRYTNLPDNKSKPFGGAYSVHDRELTTYRDETIGMFTVNDNYTEKNAEIIKQDFLQTHCYLFAGTQVPKNNMKCFNTFRRFFCTS